MTFDIAVVGAGHHGLVAAAYLAKAGLRTVVLERHAQVGGCAITAEIASGFGGPALAHRVAIDPEIIRSLDLERHGLRVLRSRAMVTAPSADGRLLTLWADPARAAREIAGFSAKDATSYPLLLKSFAAVSAVLDSVLKEPPPSIDETSAADLLRLLKSARAFRAAGKADAYRLLRWLPMPLADFVSEWFETDTLKALIAGGGLFGAFAGPRSPGTTANLLMLACGEAHPARVGWTARGGAGAVTEALASAAHAAGAVIRLNACVRELSIGDGRVSAIVLDSGERMEARIVVSAAGPKQTLLELVDPIHLPREFIRQVRLIRARGTLAKINYAVGAVPALRGASGLDAEDRSAILSGLVRLAPDLDTIERAFDAAKYGQLPDEPWIELTVPSVLDPSLAPAGHTVSAYVQFAAHQLRGSSWETSGSALADVATRTIERYVPGFTSSIVAREIITPAMMETAYGLPGGHIFHGELALDQAFIARPLLGWARFNTPIPNLFLCGAGSYPGTGLDGRSGALAAQQIVKNGKW